MFNLAMGFGGPYDIAIVAVVVLVLFGGSKFAEFARSAGQGIRDFKKAAQDDTVAEQDAAAKSANSASHS